jgi:hypothetical protein
VDQELIEAIARWREKADDFYLPEKEEAEKALADSRMVSDFVIKKLSL